MNIVTYAAQNMKPFQDQAFHSVDSLILSCVVYMHFPRANPALCDWDGVPLPALFHAEDFDTIFEHVYDAPASKELLTALVASPRFREIRVKGYVQQSDRSEEKQFAAMTFDLPDGSSYIAFRGTDATIVGWKEDVTRFRRGGAERVLAVRGEGKQVENRFHENLLMNDGNRQGGKRRGRSAGRPRFRFI